MNSINKLVYGVIAASMLVAAPMKTYALPFAPNSINISGDRGGKIIEYALRVKKAERSGKKVRFRGGCSSACTLYLSLPRSQTCISPGAKFRFHLPYSASARGNRVAAKYMRRSYPGWVRSWINRNGGLTNRLITMDYEYASKYLQPCEVRVARTIKVKTSNSFGFSKRDQFAHTLRLGFR